MKKPTKFSPSRAIENQFARALQKIAKASGDMVVKAFLREVGKKPVDEKSIRKFINRMPKLREALEAYSEALTPWAENQSKKVLGDVLKRINSDKAYQAYARRMGEALSKELFQSETGLVAMTLLNEQVTLIKSIPMEAGERAQKLVLQGLTTARRADEIASELMKTTEVTESRARLIARTETARANTALNLARATAVGSTHYKWVTAGDADVRHSHKKMNGKVFKWDSPPTLSDGTTGHPGTFPNCRCYAEPILPDE